MAFRSFPLAISAVLHERKPPRILLYAKVFGADDDREPARAREIGRLDSPQLTLDCHHSNPIVLNPLPSTLNAIHLFSTHTKTIAALPFPSLVP
jgi:hypothetical protein